MYMCEQLSGHRSTGWNAHVPAGSLGCANQPAPVTEIGAAIAVEVTDPQPVAERAGRREADRRHRMQVPRLIGRRPRRQPAEHGLRSRHAEQRRAIAKAGHQRRALADRGCCNVVAFPVAVLTRRVAAPRHRGAREVEHD